MSENNFNENNELELNETEINAYTEVPAAEPEPSKSFNWKKEAVEWIQAIVFAVIIAIIIKTFLFTLVLVQGPSMENTLHTGDRLFVTRLMYEPKNGDIIVFTPERDTSKPYIKRIIATEGQTVDITEGGQVIVDGKVLDETYLSPFTGNNEANITRTSNVINAVEFPITVPEGHFFAMGDNRIHSHDCRSKDVGNFDNEAGCVGNERAIGKAQFRIWPLNKFGSLY